MIKKVHIIYKTHLDIGFTDFASEVKKRYFEDFIPKAIKLADKVNTDEKISFIWTTGSWLIWAYLKEAPLKEALKLEESIKKGYIRWHAMPFTTHTELMNDEMMTYLLNYSKKLDIKFGKKTIAAKMTDVPGHTKAIVKYMYEAGIKYLHIGVNPASSSPDVPEIFIWKDGESEIIVNYSKEYGNEVKLPNHDEILVFAHSGDNCGPPSENEIYENIKKYELIYPNAEVMASTLDAFSESIETFKEKLPIIEKEIGDTWIHGLASDPHKIRVFKIFMNKIQEWQAAGKISKDSEMYSAIMDKLVMIPEHTWGMDIKLHFSDYKNYTISDFNKAREKDFILKGVPLKYEFIELFSMKKEEKIKEKIDKKYSKMELSWEEQRNYYKEAIEYLPKELQEELTNKIYNKLEKINEDEIIEINLDDFIKIGNYMVKIGKHGEINKLIHNGEVKLEGKIAEYKFKLTGELEFDGWFNDYMINLEKNLKWCLPDQGKPGMELIENRIKNSIVFKPIIDKVFLKEKNMILEVNLKFIEENNENFKLPEKIIIQYNFSSDQEISIYFKIANQKAIRMPVEQWINFEFLKDQIDWKIIKIGKEINPFCIVDKGNKNLHGVEKILNKDITFLNLDSPLVSFQGESILNFNQNLYRKNGFSINIYNNIWGTNFPLWYEDDIDSEFKFIWR